MKLFRILSCLVLVITLVLAPIPIQIPLFSQAADVEEITGSQEWTGKHIIDKNVIVKPGATLVISKGAELVFSGQSLNLQVQGNLFVKGTVKERVSIGRGTDTSSFSISAETGSRVMIRNTDISNGGTAAFIIAKETSQIAQAAASYRGAIQVNGGTVDIQNATFEQNPYAIIVSSQIAQVWVNRSRFVNNEFDVEAWSGDDFRYNWWGSPDGPRQTCYTYKGKQYCYYETIDGNFDHSNQLSRVTFKDPVLVVPGILGSKEEEGVQILDPIMHTYDNLYDAFVADGYVPEETLFTFPYEWRDSNVENAKLLQTRINEIKSVTHWPKVDIVAHSMGGLLAREYIESGYYKDDVDQLVTLATPQLGAPEAYLKWEGDGWFLNASDLYFKHIVSQEAEEAGFSDRFDYIHNHPVPSVKELLPTYDYLYDVDNHRNVMSYPNNYPRNEFLENLNSKAENLYKVEFDKIIGNIGENSTISGFDVVKVDMGKYWIHGYPLGFEIPASDRGARYSDGDSTVPYYSSRSESLKSDSLIELSSDHQGIVTDAQKDVLELLTAVRPQEEIRRGLISRWLWVSAYSPVDFQITSPSGKRVGKDFDTGKILNEIPGAYYTGFNTDNEFLTIPNPEDGEYKVVTQGTGTGGYRIEVANISKRENSAAEESIATIRGNTSPDVQEESIVEVKENVVTEKSLDTIPPITTISLSGTQGNNNWYTSDVVATLAATDNENGSGVEKIEYSLDNGTTWNVYTEPFIFSQEGVKTLQYRSIDKKGNIEETKSETIKLDKTAPEVSFSFDPETKQLLITGSDESSSVSVATAETGTTLINEAGHVTVIGFEKYTEAGKQLKFSIGSIAYDGVNSLVSAELKYEWSLEKSGGIKMLNEKAIVGDAWTQAHYLTQKNTTTIENADSRETKDGLVILTLVTEKGGINIKY